MTPAAWRLTSLSAAYRHAPGPVARFDGTNDLVRRSVNHRHLVRHPARRVNLLPVLRDSKPPRPLPHGNLLDHLKRLRVHNVHGVAAPRRHVNAPAVRGDDDAHRL